MTDSMAHVRAKRWLNKAPVKEPEKETPKNNTQAEPTKEAPSKTTTTPNQDPPKVTENKELPIELEKPIERQVPKPTTQQVPLDTPSPHKIVKKTMNPWDLFLIPPNFNFEKEEEEMENIKVVPVPVVNKKRGSTKTKSEKKRKRSESSDEDSTSEESESQDEKRRHKRHKRSRKAEAQAVVAPVVSTTGRITSTIGGLYDKATTISGISSDTIRNNVLLGLGSLCLITLRGFAQNHFQRAMQDQAAGAYPASNLPVANVHNPVPPSVVGYSGGDYSQFMR